MTNTIKKNITIKNTGKMAAMDLVILVEIALKNQAILTVINAMKNMKMLVMRMRDLIEYLENFNDRTIYVLVIPD